MVDVGPKLEDFLGCGSTSAPMGRFSGELPPEHDVGLYDSDLKSIAAGFLRGYGAEQAVAEVEKSVLPLEGKKTVDTFGQRTSIYRGVTRYFSGFPRAKPETEKNDGISVIFLQA